MLRLQCETKQYAWGQPGKASLVAALAAENSPACAIDPDAPYAELWMGAHPSGSAVIAKSGESLLAWLQRHPAALGQGVLCNFGAELPFLCKVLSIRKALSIQSHPDKVLAERLHAQQPHIYKDPHHKPELALAVRFVFCDAQCLLEISCAVERHVELQECIGATRAVDLAAAASEPDDVQRSVLRTAFTALMTCADHTYTAASQRLFDRISGIDATLRISKDSLFLRIFEQFPQDVGTLAVFFLNHVKLEPGEALYLSANEPHAYLSGDLVEAMASSDNVIRAGLTAKLRDTEVLCNSLTYRSGKPHKLQPEAVRGTCIKRYQPPFEEFQVLSLRVTEAGTVCIPAQQSPMILLCLASVGNHLLQSAGPVRKDLSLDSSANVARGTVLFVAAETCIQLHSIADEKGVCQLLAYAATANDRMFISAKDMARKMFRSVSAYNLAWPAPTLAEDLAVHGHSLVESTMSM